MTTTVYPVQKEVFRGAESLGRGAALDYGGDTAEPTYATTTSIVHPNLVYKYNDTLVTVSDETLTDVPGLDWTIAPRETWKFDYRINWERTGGSDIEFALDLPAGVEIWAMLHIPHDDETEPNQLNMHYLQGTGTVNQVCSLASATFNNAPCRIVGIAVGDGVAGGTVSLQVSKGDAAATSVGVAASSELIARRFWV